MKHTSQPKENKVFNAKARQMNRDQGSTTLEYVLGIALLFPVALGIGLSLEMVSQYRGQISLEASQYLIPCTTSNNELSTTQTANDCK
ncbi:MAG: hypothetical protein ACO3XO_04080 [Bdellovibrionota bacterium]